MVFHAKTLTPYLSRKENTTVSPLRKTTLLTFLTRLTIVSFLSLMSATVLLRRNNSYFEDYREVDGIKLPFITREESPYGFVVLRMTEIKHNVPIDQNRFVEVPDCYQSGGSEPGTGPARSLSF